MTQPRDFWEILQDVEEEGNERIDALTTENIGDDEDDES